MATENAVGFAPTLGVVDGGTGVATLADHGVLIGSGVGAITVLSVGSTGELLVGATAADPAFGTSAGADFTFTSATASVNRILTVANTDNTGAATSQATLQLTTGGANVGDPKITHTVTGAASFTVGIDNSDSDAYKISASTALGTTDAFRMTTDGLRTLPLQPAFLAVLSATQTDVTGNGTYYPYVCNTVILNQGSNYDNSTGVFTAPVSGRYFFVAKAEVTDCTTVTTCILRLLDSSGNAHYNGYTRVGTSTDICWQIDAFIDLDAADTVTPSVSSNGEGADTCDVVGTGALTTFGGYLAC